MMDLNWTQDDDFAAACRKTPFSGLVALVLGVAGLVRERSAQGPAGFGGAMGHAAG